MLAHLPSHLPSPPLSDKAAKAKQTRERDEEIKKEERRLRIIELKKKARETILIYYKVFNNPRRLSRPPPPLDALETHLVRLRSIEPAAVAF